MPCVCADFFSPHFHLLTETAKTPNPNATPRISDETFVAPSSSTDHITSPPKKTASVTSRVTLATFLRSHPPPPPPHPPFSGHDDFALPQIPYSLRTRKLAITIIWIIILLDSVILPLALFFILKYAAHWSDIKNLAISNGVFGFCAFIQYALRMYRLLRPSPEYRPLGTGRWALDMYQYQFTTGFIAITLLLSFATGPQNLRLIALAPTILPAMCGPQFLFSCICHKRRWRIPVNFSSTPRGSIAPPAVFTVVEDVIAVDAARGREFRAAWGRRYEASPGFRRMMYRLTVFWGWGCVGCVVVTVGVVWGVGDRYVAFAVGWVAPFVWAGVWAGATTMWVGRMLGDERREWEEHRGRRWEAE